MLEQKSLPASLLLRGPREKCRLSRGVLITLCAYLGNIIPNELSIPTKKLCEQDEGACNLIYGLIFNDLAKWFTCHYNCDI